MELLSCPAAGWYSTARGANMNEHILQLMNKMKYPFSRCKNLIKRKREQEKGNITRKENLVEKALIVTLGALVVLTVAGLIIVFAVLPG